MRMITGNGQKSFHDAMKKYGTSLLKSEVRITGAGYVITEQDGKTYLSKNGNRHNIHSTIGKKPWCIYFNDGKDTFSSENI